MKIAFVLINCELGSENSIIEELKHTESVKEILPTFGAYDIVTKVQAGSSENLREIITWQIRKLPNIRSTLTLLKSC